MGNSPIDSRKTRCASSLGSRGRVFERSGITISVWQEPFRSQDPTHFKLTHYPIPPELQGYTPLIEVCQLERMQIGKIGYLTVQENSVASRVSQRRPGIHTDKHPSAKWGGGAWGSGTMPKQDGIYLASTVDDSCRAWDVHIETPGPMGDCEHLREELAALPPVSMKANELYWITDSCPHESLPLEPGTFRQFFRLVTHKVALWYAKHSTPNRLGVEPPCQVIHGNKFDSANVPQFADAQRAGGK